MTQTDDSVQIVTGLWALGFYEAQDAIKRMLEIVESGSRNQRLTISYYNRYMQFSEYSDKAAQKILETYPEDLQMAAAFMPTYMDAVDTIARNCIRDEKNKVVYSVNEENLKYIPLDVHELFDTEEKARLHYGILKNLADSMKKKKVEYVPLVFPWYGAALEKSDLTQRMAVIAYALQDQALIDDVCIRLSDITDSYYNTRKNYVRILLYPDGRLADPQEGPDLRGGLPAAGEASAAQERRHQAQCHRPSGAAGQGQSRREHQAPSRRRTGADPSGRS